MNIFSLHTTPLHVTQCTNQAGMCLCIKCLYMIAFRLGHVFIACNFFFSFAFVFSHFESNLNSTICPSGDFSHLLLDLMPSLTLLAVCVRGNGVQCTNADFKSFIFSSFINVHEHIYISYSLSHAPHPIIHPPLNNANNFGHFSGVKK